MKNGLTPIFLRPKGFGAVFGPTQHEQPAQARQLLKAERRESPKRNPNSIDVILNKVINVNGSAVENRTAIDYLIREHS